MNDFNNYSMQEIIYSKIAITNFILISRIIRSIQDDL